MSAAFVPLRRYVISIKDGTHGTHERVDEGIPLLSAKNVRNESIVIGPEDLRITSDEFLEINRSGYLEPGDVLLTIVGTIGRTAIYDGKSKVAFQRSVASLRPAANCYGRYLFYCLSSSLVQEQLEASAHQAAQSGIYLGEVANVALPLQPLSTQRVIAGYLDRETARIDALIATKQRMVELLEERTWITFSERVARSQPQSVPLRRVLSSLIDGPFGSAFSSSDYSDTGAIVIRLGNIGFGRYRSTDEARIPMDMFEEFRQYQVNQGDLLIAGLGDDRNHAGRACVAPDLGPAIVKGKCFRGRVIPDRANAEFLALLLSSPLGAGVMSVSGRGSTRSMINLEIVKNTEIPLPERHVQDSIMAVTRADEVQTARMTSVLGKQLGLLRERRQTLITAAVTGQLEIPEAA